MIENAKSGGRKRRRGFGDRYPNITTVEKRGIEHIPIENRWGTPSDLFWMWAGAIWNIAFVLYGSLAVLIFGLSFTQAVVVILLGNMFYLLTGFASLQGPYAGTTTFAISRAAFGPRGNKVPAMFNWVTLVGFEIIAVTVIVQAAIAFSARAGFRAGRPAELTFTVVAVAIQAILPVLGHSAILRVLRLLAIPFAILFVIMAAITATKMDLNSGHSGAGWGAMLVFLALVISAGGLGWTEAASDYSRYLPPSTDKWRIVLAVSLGGAIPSILLEILGAALATGVPGAKTIEGLTVALPSWFVLPYLTIVTLQLFAGNTLNLYSSGVTLQSLIPNISRLGCVVIDSVLCGIFAAYVILSSRFFSLLSDFLLFGIVWLAPWCAIYLTDAWLRRNRYDYEGLLSRDGGRYSRNNGVHIPAIIAQFVGMAAAALWLNAYPPYVGFLSNHIDKSDFSVFMGLLLGGLTYWLLARVSVRAEGKPSSSYHTDR